MNKKMKKYIKIAYLVLVIGSIILSINYNGGIIDSDSSNFVNIIRDSLIFAIEDTFFVDLYYSFYATLFGDSFISEMIFCTFVYFISIDLLSILYDLLMFIPNVVSKMLDKVGKVGVKDE